MNSSNSGVLSKTFDFLKSLSDKLFKYICDVDNDNVKMEKEKKLDSSSVEFECLYQDTIPFFVVIKKLDEDTFDMTVRIDDKSVVKYSKVNGKDYEKKLNAALNKLMDKDTKLAFGLKANKTLKVTLQKIVSAKEISINLKAITANYDVYEANAALNSVLDNDDFINEITEEPVSFEINDIGDEFDICSTEFENDDLIRDAIYNLSVSAYNLFRDMQLMNWECAFNEPLFRRTEEYVYTAFRDIKYFGNLSIELYNEVINPFYDTQLVFSEDVPTTPHSPMDVGIERIDAILDNYISTLEFFYPNFSHDIQYELDAKIRCLKQERDFWLKQVD